MFHTRYATDVATYTIFFVVVSYSFDLQSRKRLQSIEDYLRQRKVFFSIDRTIQLIFKRQTTGIS